MDQKQLARKLNKLQIKVEQGRVNLFTLMRMINHLCLATHKSMKGFFHYANITYSQTRQIYFNGRTNRKGSGKAIQIHQMPKIVNQAKDYLLS